MVEARVGVIGGSGLYEMGGLSEVEEVRLLTPFGEPSDAYVVGVLEGRRVAFLARHGRGHRRMPSEVDYRANIYGFKLLGVERIISVSAVGSLREEIAPLHVVLPDQLVDWTRRRPSTFFGDGVVAHVSMAEPFCPELRRLLVEKGRVCGATVHDGGAYLCIEGPQFSTRAESEIYRAWGMSVIGMTNATEAKLAREASVCYATIALVTDYDCWRREEEPVTVAQVVGRLRTNAELAGSIIRAVAAALITDLREVPDAALERLRPILGRLEIR